MGEKTLKCRLVCEFITASSGQDQNSCNSFKLLVELEKQCAEIQVTSQV